MRTMIVTSLALSACTSTVDVLESTTTRVGPEGGVAKSADGVFSVEFSDGALLADESIVIRTDRSTSLADQISHAYEVIPSRELNGARVRFSLDSSIDGEGRQIARVTGSNLERIGGELSRQSLTVEVAALGRATYIIVGPPPPPPPPPISFTCTEGGLPSGREPVAITRIPGNAGASDFIALLSDAGNRAHVTVQNPLQPSATRSLEYPDETARAIYGFFYERGGLRPALAVITSRAEGGREVGRLYVYEWTGGELVPHDGSGGPGTIGTPILLECAMTLCPTGMGMPCALGIEFQTAITIKVADIDYDDKFDLAITSSSDLPLLYYRSSEASAGAMYSGCTCGKYAQAPTVFEIAQFGGPGEPVDMQHHDIIIGAPGGIFVRYGAAGARGDEVSCGQPMRFGGLVPMRDLARGSLRCGSSSCQEHEDVVLVAARSLGGGSFDDPGAIHVIFGAPIDHPADENLYDTPGASVELVAQALPGEEDPRDPRTVEVGDIDADGTDDIAVLFGASEEVHVWLNGASGFDEIDSGINLKSCTTASICSPAREFVLADVDADGPKEVVVICNPTSNATLRTYRLAP